MVADENEPTSPQRAILQAAMDVIAEKKISGTRMHHIAERANISQGTLHYHFPTKADLYLALLDEMARLFDSDRRELAKSVLEPSSKLRLFPQQQHRLLTDLPKLEEVFLDFWGHARMDPAIQPKIRWLYEMWRQDITDVIRAGIEAGDFDPEHAELAPFLLVGLLEGAALQYLIDRESFDLEAYFDLTHRMILDLLGGAPRQGLVRQPYPTDLSDEQWERVAPLFPPAKPGGRPRGVDLREVLNGILYVAACGCSWRMLPHDFPHWQTVYGYYNRWARLGILAQINARLGVEIPLPAIAISD